MEIGIVVKVLPVYGDSGRGSIFPDSPRGMSYPCSEIRDDADPKGKDDSEKSKNPDDSGNNIQVFSYPLQTPAMSLFCRDRYSRFIPFHNPGEYPWCVAGILNYIEFFLRNV